jgi:hypothetical protein
VLITTLKYTLTSVSSQGLRSQRQTPDSYISHDDWADMYSADTIRRHKFEVHECPNIIKAETELVPQLVLMHWL